MAMIIMGERKGQEGPDKQELRQVGTLQSEHTRLQDQDARNYPTAITSRKVRGGWYATNYRTVITIQHCPRQPLPPDTVPWRSCPSAETSNSLIQWFSTFLKQQPLDIASHAMETPKHKIISLLLYNYSFAIVMNHNVNSWYAGCEICGKSWPTGWEPVL